MSKTALLFAGQGAQVVGMGKDLAEKFPSAKAWFDRANAALGYDLGANEIERSQFHLLWPGTAINVMPGRPNISIGPIVPLEPARTRRFLDYFFAPGEDEAWIAEYLAFDDQVGVEDRTLVEGVQRGVASGALDGGRLLVSSETLIADFGRRVAAALD